jgi:hypothetical protein
MMQPKPFRLGLGILLLFVLGTVPAIWGQAVNGTLLGTATDTTGATVANAKVSATATTTGAIYQSTTNESGNYTFPGLPPGRYSVTVEAQGFKNATHENIDLLSNSTARVDISMFPGNVSETVVVTTEPPVLQTDRADISTKIESATLVDMALGSNRNFQSLLNVVPGVAPQVFQHSQFFNASSSLQTEVNGMPRQGNLYQIEGIDDNERTGILQILIPPAESIASVDISTNNFDAELGRATGAVTNVTLKSGTNNFHGSAFEFLQNNVANARSYFSTQPLGHLSYNYFGGAVGGPILKNRLFFFGDYLRTADHEAISSTFTIPDSRFYTPTLGLANCSDSQGCVNLSGAMNGSAGQVFDPATGDGRTVAQGGTPRTAFPGNLIPFSRVNPVSLAILKGINTAAAKYGTLVTKAMNAPQNNYSTNLPFTKTTDSFDTKIDYALNEKNHVSGRFSFQHAVTFQQAAFGGFYGGPAGGGFEGTGDQKAYSTGVNYDHVFSPTFFTEVRVGVAHLRNNAQPNDYNTSDATTIGIPGVNISGQPFTTGQAAVTLGVFSGPLLGYSGSEPWVRGEANIDFVNNWTKIKGNHTIKAGVDLRRVRDDLLQDQTFGPRGAFTFAESQTSDAAASGSVTDANDIASFLLDVPSQTGRDLNTFFPCYRQWWFFAYATDKWQATPKMTVDLGVQWDFFPPATPRIAGGFANYNPTNDTLVMAGLGSNPSNLGMITRYHYFAPRTGISYRVSDSTVIRGGFGMSYLPFQDNTYAYNYPIRANNSYQPVGASSFTPAVLADGATTATFQAGFPAPVAVTIPSNGIIALPQSTTGLTGVPLLQAKQLIAQVYTYIPLNFKNPYTTSWNVAIQQALKGDMSLQVAYVANHGTDVAGNQNINLPSTYGGGSNSDPEFATFGRTAATNQYFLGFSSNYESLQVQLTKRASHGLAYTSAFTWGKGLGYISGDDNGLTFFINWRRNYARNDYDREFNYEQTFTYELPFGRGHKLMSSGIGDAVVGGWKLTGLVSIVSGLPFTVTASGTSLNTPGTAQTATLTGGFKKLKGIGSASKWFDPTVFSQPSGCTATPCTNPGLGNTGRNQFSGPGYIQDNLSIFKKFTVFREVDLETRLDAFQLSNTPQFGQPNGGGVTSASFGNITGTLGSGQGSVNGVGGGRTLQISGTFRF